MAPFNFFMQSRYPIQIKENHYLSADYITSARWSSYSVIIRTVLEKHPSSILEIGPGNGVVTAALRQMGFIVKTLDFDGKLSPDYVADVSGDNLSDILGGQKFDLVIAAQVLEHIQYEDFVKAVGNLAKIADRAVISLPHTTDNSFLMSFSFKIPFLKKFSFLKKIIYKKKAHQFNGQHYWEIGKAGYPLRRIKRDMEKNGWKIEKDFLNPENPYHYFFILHRQKSIDNS